MKNTLTLLFSLFLSTGFAQVSTNPDTDSSIDSIGETVSISENIPVKISHNEVLSQNKGMMIYPKIKPGISGTTDTEVIVRIYEEGKTQVQCIENQNLQNNQNGKYFMFIPYCSLNLERNKIHKIRLEVETWCKGTKLKGSRSYRAIVNLLE